MASKQYSSKKYKDWEVVEIKSKLKGKRKSRTLRVKSTSTAEEECRVQIEESLSASVECLTFEDIQSLRENADKANQTQATSKSSEQTPVGRLTTTQQTQVPAALAMELTDINEEQSSLSSQWKESEYSVYLYSPNQQATENQIRDVKTPDSGFSLTMVGSSISRDKEHLVRGHVATKMSQGTLYHSSGQVTTLDPEIFPPPSQSYYCLLKVNSSDEGDSEQLRQYLVCFLSIGKEGLDLFRTDLDAYCMKLIPLLKELPLEDPYTAFPQSKLELRLNTWFSDNVTYLVRVVQRCQSQLAALLHTAVNSQVEVTGDDLSAVRDVKQFLNACSLANLMQLGSVETTPTSESEFTRNIKIHISKESCQLSSEESSKFCHNWAQVLLSQGTTSPDPFFLRHAVENYKLKIIQDINALKRLLRAAEMDYHALYRCYLFLCSCGNGKLLLGCAMQEARSLPSAETLAVLKALQVYSDKSGFGDL